MEEIARAATPEIGKGISTYPNPVLQNMQISYPAAKSGAVDLRVYDLTGRQLLQKKVNAGAGQNLFQLNLNGLTPGTYMLQTRNGAELTTRKFQVGSK